MTERRYIWTAPGRYEPMSSRPILCGAAKLSTLRPRRVRPGSMRPLSGRSLSTTRAKASRLSWSDKTRPSRRAQELRGSGSPASSDESLRHDLLSLHRSYAAGQHQGRGPRLRRDPPLPNENNLERRVADYGPGAIGGTGSRTVRGSSQQRMPARPLWPESGSR